MDDATTEEAGVAQTTDLGAAFGTKASTGELSGDQVFKLDTTAHQSAAHPRNGREYDGEGTAGHDHHNAKESNGHLASIYEGQAEQFASVIPFIKQGLARGERCLYVADDNTIEEIRAAFRRGGIDVTTAIEDGALSIRTETDTYLTGGEFETGEMLQFWQETLAEAKGEGYAGLRAAAEMTWALGEGTLGENGRLDRLADYEAVLNSLFAREDYVVLCQYNRKRFPEAILSDVIRSHPLVVCEDTVCENSFYQCPTEFLGEDRVPLDVDRAIAELTSHSPHTHVERQQDECSRREKRLRRWARQKEVIARLGRLGLEEGEVDRLLSAVANRAAEALGADCCSVLETRSEPKGLRLREAAGTEEKAGEASGIDARTGSLAARALQAGSPVIENDLEAYARSSSSGSSTSDPSVSEGASGIGTIIGPTDDPWGALTAHTSGQQMFAEQDAAFLQSVANTVASAIKRAEQEGYEREFHKITTDTDLTFNQKVEQLLDLGRDRFGLDVGLLTRKEGEEFRIVAASGAPDVVEPGVTVVDPLPDQYCRRTVTRDDPLWIEDAEAVGWDDDPLYREYGLECYLGVKVTVGNRIYGTFCFAEGEAQKRQFTEADRTFLDLMGRWLSDELGRLEREKKLQRSKDRFKRVFHGSHDPILIVEPEGDEIIDGNAAASEMLGYSRDQLLSLNPSDLHPDEMEKFRQFVEGVFEEGTGWSGELACQPKNGDPIPAAISASAVQIGGRTCMLAVVRDVSERKEHERLQRRLYEIAASTGRSFEDKLGALFDLGRDYFDLEVGGLARIDPEADRFEVKATRGHHDYVVPGKEYPYSETYCQIAPGKQRTAAVTDPVSKGFEEMLCYKKFGVRAYLGTRIEIDGETNHSFFFLSNDSREEPFSETERTFLDLMGQWVEYELNKKRREEDLRELNETLEERVEKRTRQVRDLTAKVTLAEQRERDRIARLLHDGLQQRLYGSQLQVSSLRRDIQDAGRDELVGRIQKVEDEIEAVRHALRQLSVGMSPPVLDGDGLKGVLEWLQSYMLDAHGLTVDLTAEKEFRVEEEMRVLLFRATKELLATLAERADASKVTVHLYEEAKEFVIEVAGEGRGLTPETIKTKESEGEFGLTVASERLRLFGGELTLTEQSEERAHAEIRVPIAAQGPPEKLRDSELTSDPDLSPGS